MKFIVLFIASVFIFSQSIAQEGSFTGGFRKGFYYDNAGKKVEGFIKYILKSSETEKGAVTKLPKKIKFRKDKSDKAGTKVLLPKDISSFSVSEYGNVYHTLYKSPKSKAKGKGAYFAKVLFAEESPTLSKAALYFVPNQPVVNTMGKSGKFPNAFIVRNGDLVKKTTNSLILPKYKRTFAKIFVDCQAFLKKQKQDKKFLNIGNIKSVIDYINSDCK